MSERKRMSVGKMFMYVVFMVLFFIGLFSVPKIIETVEKGTYQIKQAAISGTMTAKMSPGLWMQYWGDIDTWPKAETFFFTHDKDTKDDVDADSSIEVRFQDGSVCKISGTARVIMPTSPQDAINLVINRNHKTYKDLEQKLILPTIRNVLRSTANLMTARESYSVKRLDFVTFARDQIENGVYQTEESVKEIEDLVTGEKVRKEVKAILRKGGVPLYQANPMGDTGIRLVNFEIKSFRYENKVRNQIGKQQEARMNVETAKAKAEEARQRELQTVAEGLAAVAKAKYEKEQEKVRAVVDAEKDKEVAILQASKKLEEAKLLKLAAKENKLANILDGQGLAEKKRLILAADGALEQKLATYKAVQNRYAAAIENYKGNWVPTVMTGGTSGGNGNAAMTMIEALSIKALKDLALDLEVKK